jgi:hypothetical protein
MTYVFVPVLGLFGILRCLRLLEDGGSLPVHRSARLAGLRGSVAGPSRFRDLMKAGSTKCG